MNVSLPFPTEQGNWTFAMFESALENATLTCALLSLKFEYFADHNT